MSGMMRATENHWHGLFFRGEAVPYVNYSEAVV
jgi:hypothetical protein